MKFGLGKVWEKIAEKKDKKEFPSFHGNKEEGRNLKGRGATENSLDDFEVIDEDKRLRDKSKNFVPIEDVADKSAVGAIYRQAEGKGLREVYDHEAEFENKASKILNNKECERLFSFLKKLDETDTRKDYIGYNDEKGVFVPPSRWMPRDITKFIKRVNERRPIIKSVEHEYDDEGKLIETEEKEVPAYQIHVKIKDSKKKEKRKIA